MWNQKLNKKSEIQKGGMEMDRKYSSIKESLENTSGQTIPSSTQETGLRYFKALSQLSVDILLEENQINELKRKIEWMRGKFGAMSAKYAMKKRKEEQKRIIHCEHEDCGVTFVKDRDMHYHKLFEHEGESLFRDGVFSFRVEEEENSSE